MCPWRIYGGKWYDRFFLLSYVLSMEICVWGLRKWFLYFTVCYIMHYQIANSFACFYVPRVIVSSFHDNHINALRIHIWWCIRNNKVISYYITVVLPQTYLIDAIFVITEVHLSQTSQRITSMESQCFLFIFFLMYNPKQCTREEKKWKYG